MTLLPPGVKVHLAFGFIDMRKGIDGLAMLVQGSPCRPASQRTYLDQPSCLPMTPRSRCSISDAAAPRPAGSGSTPAMTGPGRSRSAGRCLLLQS